MPCRMLTHPPWISDLIGKLIPAVGRQAHPVRAVVGAAVNHEHIEDHEVSSPEIRCPPHTRASEASADMVGLTTQRAVRTSLPSISSIPAVRAGCVHITAPVPPRKPLVPMRALE